MSDSTNAPNEFQKKIYSIDNWQKIHVQQLSYTRNLFIILASAALGYTLSLINHDLECIYSILFKILSFIYLSSIAFGAFIAYSESENYRLKYLIARNLERSLPIEEEEKQCSKIESRNRGLIIIQLVLFLIGIITETILLLIK